MELETESDSTGSEFSSTQPQIDRRMQCGIRAFDNPKSIQRSTQREQAKSSEAVISQLVISSRHLSTTRLLHRLLNSISAEVLAKST